MMDTIKITPPDGLVRVSCRTCRGTKVKPKKELEAALLDECYNQAPAIEQEPCDDCNGKGIYKIKRL